MTRRLFWLQNRPETRCSAQVRPTILTQSYGNFGLTLHRVLPHAQLISIFRVSWRYATPPAHQGLGYSGRSCNQAARPNVQGDEGTLRWQVPGGRKAASWAERHSRAAYRAGGSVHLFSIPRETLHGGPCDDPG